MNTRRNLSEAQKLELYKTALENAKNQEEIAAILADLGYDEATLDQGRTILSETEEVYRFNHKEDQETTEASANFKAKKEELEISYTLHRKKAKVIFRKDSISLEKLGVIGMLPQSFTKWMEKVKLFYTIANEDMDVQTKMLRLKITAEDITAALVLIAAVEQAKNHYLLEKGESQDATKQKNQAFERADDWMSEFFSVAKIGLEDRPQLMESLGKIVLS